eukprot:3081485-Pleurochrysis_carterae.AAC.1
MRVGNVLTAEARGGPAKPASMDLSKLTAHAAVALSDVLRAWASTQPSPLAVHKQVDRHAARALGESNALRLCALSNKEVARFHTSATEALTTAARLARVNTGKPLLVAFGHGAHGWGDGVAAEGVALGDERYACDVLTLREMSAHTLKVLRLRRDEIAAVLVNPIQ